MAKFTRESFKAELLRRNSEVLLPSKDGSLCLYHGPGGRRCPVGLCIPNRKWRKGYDGVIGPLDPNDPTSAVAALVTLPTGVDLFELKCLQELHDRLAANSRWPKREFAKAVKEILG